MYAKENEDIAKDIHHRRVLCHENCNFDYSPGRAVADENVVNILERIGCKRHKPWGPSSSDIPTTAEVSEAFQFAMDHSKAKDDSSLFQRTLKFGSLTARSKSSASSRI
jgi:hypothetical protein